MQCSELSALQLEETCICQRSRLRLTCDSSKKKLQTQVQHGGRFQLLGSPVSSCKTKVDLNELW